MSLRVGAVSAVPSDGGSGAPATNYNGFIQISDTQFTEQAPQTLKAETWTVLRNNGALDSNKSSVPTSFASHDLVVGDKFMPKAVGDTYMLRLTFTALSTTSGNNLTVRLSAPDVVQQDTKAFVTNAGDKTMFTFNYTIASFQSFKDSGGLFQVFADYDATLWGVGLLIIPVSHL